MNSFRVIENLKSRFFLNDRVCFVRDLIIKIKSTIPRYERFVSCQDEFVKIND